MMERNCFDKPLVFAVKHGNDIERMKSQSGGAFALLSDAVLGRGGIVYGCAFDETFQAVHIRGESAGERDRMRYSKYVQSNMGDIFKNVLADLKEGRTVLFSGTSCQVAGLNRFLEMSPGKMDGTLYTTDIVCHGVPSPMVWRDYLAWVSRKKQADIKAVICRNKKKYGWKSHVVTMIFENGRSYDSRVFPKIFYSHTALRPACYRCPYKSINHPSDITIADFWGIERALPGFKDDKGVSLVLINSDIGQALFNDCQGNMISKPAKIANSMQKPLAEPYDPPADREMFWKDYGNLPFDEIAGKYGDYSFYKELNWKIKVFIKRKAERLLRKTV